MAWNRNRNHNNKQSNHKQIFTVKYQKNIQTKKKLNNKNKQPKLNHKKNNLIIMKSPNQLKNHKIRNKKLKFQKKTSQLLIMH